MAEALRLVVGVFGTTISPYLYFWQAAQEVEDVNAGPEHLHPPAEACGLFRRVKWDTVIGMTFSSLIAFIIILSTAATLHQAGITDRWAATSSAAS
jgi:Mn2+/Fe2+ NRAMP family transporter